MSETTDQDALPTVSATVREDGSGEVVFDGATWPITAPDVRGARAAMLELVAERVAGSVGTPVQVRAVEPDGEWMLVVHPDGRVEEIGGQAHRRRGRRSVAPVTTVPAAEPVTTVPAAEPVIAVVGATALLPVQASPAPPTPSPAPLTRREVHSRSFLTETRTEIPAETGWRGLLARMGIAVQPSAAERAARADERAVSQHWPGPRTIAVVNGKGGANKTPTTILLAALLARNGGSGVLAWDNNPTRGTLGWRTEQGPHENTVLDLLPRTDALLAPDARAAELAHYVHHQRADKYDVLRSHPEVLATDQRITAEDFDALHTVATKYFRLIVIDSGNDESAEAWLRMIDHTDQLVVATTTREEHAESGRLLLDELARRDEHSARLARDAVVVVSRASTNESDPGAITAGFRQIAREAIAIPYDRALSGRPLLYGALAPATQRAWLRAAAALADGL